jgi:hypothetical protein
MFLNFGIIKLIIPLNVNLLCSIFIVVGMSLKTTVNSKSIFFPSSRFWKTGSMKKCFPDVKFVLNTELHYLHFRSVPNTFSMTSSMK